ncbi:MAG: ParB/RepB/Spo0J family partition protein [Candidatus Paceibacterota bacterium]|jgi:ParB family chromosome partitioning protein
MTGQGLESLIPHKHNKGGEEQHVHISVPRDVSSSYPVQSHSAPSPAVREAPHYTSPREEVREVRVVHEPHEPRDSHDKFAVQSIFHIEIEKIKPNPYQPRREFNSEELQELAQSIREFGILQPIIVCKIIKEAETGAIVEYQLIAGERRFQAAKIARLERVPAIVKQVDAGRAKLEMALIENIQRSNLNPLESARAYARLQDEFGVTQREIATRMGKSREAVANTMRLLNLPSDMQDALVQGKITESQGRALLAIQDSNAQRVLFDSLLHKKTTMREMQQIQQKALPPENPQQKFWEVQLEERFGAPIKIKRQAKGGAINIQFYSNEELQGILEKLLGPNTF